MLQGMGAGLVLFCQVAVGSPAAADEAPAAAVTVTDEPRAEKASVPVISEATVSFRNEVGEKFQLTQARFTVDGIELPAMALDVPRGTETVIFRGPMTSGRHVITSHLSYQGRNRAIFTYLDGYTLNLDSRDEVFVVSGAPSTVTVVGKDHKGFTVPYEKSLVIGFETGGAISDGNAAAARHASR